VLKGEEGASLGRPRRLAALAASSCVVARMRVALVARRLRWTGPVILIGSL